MNQFLHIMVGKALALVVAIPVLACDPGPPPSEEEPRVLGASTQGDEAAEEAASTDTPELRVVARVNTVPITALEVERRLDRIDELYRHARRPFNAKIREAKRREVIDRLIDHELLRQHAANASVELAPKTIDLAVEKRVDEHFGSTTAFKRYLDAEGLSLSDFRREVRDEMVLERTLLGDDAQEEAPRPAVSEEHLREIYQRVAAGRPAAERVRVSSVTLPTSARQLAARVGKSKCSPRGLPPEAIHRDLGWRQRHQLPAAAGFRLFDAQAPQTTSAIVPSPDGSEVAIYCVHDRRAAGVRAFDEVEPLLRERAERAHLESKRSALLQTLREEANIERIAEPSP